MPLRCVALLDNFVSDVSQLDLGYNDKTLMIRRIPKKELEEFMLPSKFTPSHPVETVKLEARVRFGDAIDVSEKRYWIDSSFFGGTDRRAKLMVYNCATEEMERLILGFRLFKEGNIRMVFYFMKGEYGTLSIPLRTLHGHERPYSLNKSELKAIEDFWKEYLRIVWEKRNSKTSLGIALNRFTDGYERFRHEDKVIDFMIGLEALYLQGEGTGEFSYKMAHRVSSFLSNDKQKQKELFLGMRDSYN